jgi:hypothetical protein
LGILNQISNFKNNTIMKELSIEKMEMVSGGCSSTDLFAYAGFASYYGHKYAKTGSDGYQLAWIFYTSKIFGCI